MTIFSGYVGAKSCTSGPQPGVVAFSRAALAAIPESWSDGIYNCRPMRGTKNTTSLHGEGRAFDWGCKKGAKWARRAADFLVAHSKELGIQCVIYDRHIWSGAHPRSGWRRYDGVDSHTTHLHVEFSWAAALHLTQAQAAHYLESLGGDDMPLTSSEKNEIADLTVSKLLRASLKNSHDGTVASLAAWLVYGNEKSGLARDNSAAAVKAVDDMRATLNDTVAKAATAAVKAAIADGTLTITLTGAQQ